MRLVIILLVVVLAVFSLVGCGNQSNNAAAPNPTVAANVALIQTDYFPMDVGHEWAYQISISEVAYTFEEVYWSVGGDQAIVTAHTGFLYPSVPSRLKLRIENATSVQGPFKYPDGVKLTVVQDDVNVFLFTKELFYNATHDSGSTNVQLVMTFESSGSPSPGQTVGDGYSVRMMFFTVSPGSFQYALMNANEGKPIEEVSINDSVDTLTFMGFDTKVSGYEGQMLMHFQRKTSTDNSSREVISVTEDLWFAQHLGLVLLVQKSNGDQTMTWVLESIPS